ncbi:MAG TPA: TIR domain-containing protein [Caulobacteraceae bacterium]|nr:TIR domain-containing protein [Caulobacteraceae bacterium]
MAERPEPSYVGDQPFVFVSYGHADSELVFPEMRWLQEAGFNLWHDDGIHVGSVWRKAIADALTAAAGMLFVATKSSVESDHCLKELSFVLDEGKPVFVVQLDDTKLPGLLRLSLADRQMLNRAEFDEKAYRAKLVQALSTVAKPAPRAPAEKASSPAAPPAAAIRYTNNLPKRLGALIGRESEMGELVGLLERADLVTITGTGGVGKTRIAIEVGLSQLDAYEDGVWLVELAPVSEPEQVPVAIARAMNIELPGGQDPQEALVDRLRARECLVLLDNCEHVIDAVAGLAGAVLDASDSVKMLASSQELLGVEGERVFRLRSLGEADAAELFVERAQAVEATFKADARNRDAIAAICHRLDGIPLALEMAAARAPALGCEGVLQRLDDRFRVLTGGRRTALPRQRTLLATLDWSHGLLNEIDAAVFRRLGVFTGGFTLEAASEVAADDRIDEFAVMDALSSLVAKSLVVAETENDRTRYRLLETTRAYALEKLDAAGETLAVQRGHAEWVNRFLEPFSAEMWGVATDDEIAARYYPELDNIERAIDWAFGPTGEPDLGIAIVAASGWLWGIRSLYPTYLPWVGAATGRLSATTPQAVRTAFLIARASAFMMGNQGHALEVIDEGVQAARASGDRHALIEALDAAGYTFLIHGRLDETKTVSDESLALAAELPLSRLVTQARHLAAWVIWQTVGEQPAAPLFGRIVMDLRSFGADGLANWFLVNAVTDIVPRSDHDIAIPNLRDVLARIRPSEMFSTLSVGVTAQFLLLLLAERAAPGDFDEGIQVARAHRKASGLNGAAYINNLAMALIAIKSDRADDAAKLFGLAERQRAAVGSELPISRELFNDLRSRLREGLPEAEIAALMAEGASLTADEAFRLATGGE